MTSTTTPKENQNTTTAAAQRIKKLETAVIDIDALAKSGLSQISAIANLLMLSLKVQDADFPRKKITVAGALSAMRMIADDVESCIDSMAEDAMCNDVQEVAA